MSDGAKNPRVLVVTTWLPSVPTATVPETLAMCADAPVQLAELPAELCNAAFVTGEVIMANGRYCLRTDTGELHVLEPQSEGARLLGKRLLVYGTFEKG